MDLAKVSEKTQKRKMGGDTDETHILFACAHVILTAFRSGRIVCRRDPV